MYPFHFKVIAFFCICVIPHFSQLTLCTELVIFESVILCHLGIELKSFTSQSSDLPTELLRHWELLSNLEKVRIRFHLIVFAFFMEWVWHFHRLSVVVLHLELLHTKSWRHHCSIEAFHCVNSFKGYAHKKTISPRGRKKIYSLSGLVTQPLTRS